jgi:Uma2 family endonuclease
MSTPAISSPSPDALDAANFFRLTVPQYHEMIANRILGEDDPVELLDGILLTKMSKNPHHRSSSVLLQQALSRRVPEGYHFELQDPITLETSEPEPDASIIRGDVRDYLDRHPGPADTELVIEIADDSLRRDREWKRRVYARAGIPTYWIVNLVDRVLEVYASPAAAQEGFDYAESRILSEADVATLSLGGADVATVPVKDLLP